MHHWLRTALLLSIMTFPSAAKAQELAMGSCEVVARIHDRVVCRAEVEISDEAQDDVAQEYKANGIDPAVALQQRRLDRLGTIIWDTALSHEFGDAISSTAQEVTDYNSAFKSKLDSNFAKDQRTLAEVNKHLENPDLTAPQKQSLLELKTALETSITFYAQRAKQRESLPPEFFKMMADTEQEMAEGFLRQWNIAQHLYHKYGGRVVAVSGRYEPVEAYLKFLADIEAQPSLEIYSADYEDALRLLTANWQIVGETGQDVTKAEADEYFASPLNQFSAQ